MGMQVPVLRNIDHSYMGTTCPFTGMHNPYWGTLNVPHGNLTCLHGNPTSLHKNVHSFPMLGDIECSYTGTPYPLMGMYIAMLGNIEHSHMKIMCSHVEKH
jgi:hypothetical protein